MATNFASELKSKVNSNIHIKNPDIVNKKINGIINGGFPKLQIVSDFDATLTKQHENGKKYMSSFLMFEKCPSVTQSYLDTTTALLHKYKAKEFDFNIPMDEKRRLMEEWWIKSSEALVGLTVTDEEIDDVVSKLGTSLRDHTLELFHDLSDQNVPVLVFSAGLGATVVSVLKHSKVLFDNVKVISNFFDYDENHVISGLKPPLIHVLNKNEYALENSEYYDLIKDRDNVILMGDSLGDAHMADGMSHAEHVLKIGFLYEHVDGNLPAYLDTFDIVLEDDQTMDVIRAIIEFIKNTPKTKN